MSDRQVHIMTNAAGMQMFHQALIKEAKKQQTNISKGLWQQLQNGDVQRYSYSRVSLNEIKESIEKLFFGKSEKKKRLRRKMKKHGTIV